MSIQTFTPTVLEAEQSIPTVDQVIAAYPLQAFEIRNMRVDRVDDPRSRQRFWLGDFAARPAHLVSAHLHRFDTNPSTSYSDALTMYAVSAALAIKANTIKNGSEQNHMTVGLRPFGDFADSYLEQTHAGYLEYMLRRCAYRLICIGPHNYLAGNQTFKRVYAGDTKAEVFRAVMQNARIDVLSYFALLQQVGLKSADIHNYFKSMIRDFGIVNILNAFSIENYLNESRYFLPGLYAELNAMLELSKFGTVEIAPQATDLCGIDFILYKPDGAIHAVQVKGKPDHPQGITTFDKETMIRIIKGTCDIDYRGRRTRIDTRLERERMDKFLKQVGILNRDRREQGLQPVMPMWVYACSSFSTK